MQLFKVIAKRGGIATECLGFPTRTMASGFARGLAESGKCDGADIVPYDDGRTGLSPELYEAITRALAGRVGPEVKRELMLAIMAECGGTSDAR